jgi:hypothetical protein
VYIIRLSGLPLLRWATALWSARSRQRDRPILISGWNMELDYISDCSFLDWQKDTPCISAFRFGPTGT